MSFLIFLSDFIMPLMIFYIVGYGLMLRQPVYDEFIAGAKKGLRMTVEILPTLAGLMIGVSILRESGFLNDLAGAISGAAAVIGLPAPVVPLVFVKMFSSSAATGLLLDIFKEYGPDSRIGWICSILMSCTETVFYTMSVYFMSVHIKKSRYTLAGALIAALVGVAASVWLTGMI